MRFVHADRCLSNQDSLDFVEPLLFFLNYV